MLGMWTTQTKAYDEGQAGTFTGVGWEGPYRFSLAGLHTWPRTEGFIQAMPRVRYYRLPFNVHQFDENGDIHPAYEDLITRLANAGYQFLWDLHDGPMQEPNNADRKSYWPTLYPDLNTEQDWHTFLQPNGTLTTNNLLPAWTKLLDWLDAHPTIDAQTYGFEFMNEPQGYNLLRNALSGYGWNLADAYETALGYYGQANVDIYNLIAARRSGFRFFVAGFGYSRDFDRFSLPLSQLGGKSIIETMRELDANSANTLGWAAHMYPDWSGVFRTPDDLEAYLDSFYANILGDPIILTETNHNSGWTNWDNAGEQGKFYRSHFMFVQLAHWCRKRGVGYCYWPTTNYAAARLFDLEGDGEITLYSQSSLSAAMTIIAATDRAGQVFTGTQHGLLTPTVIPALLRNHPRDPEDDESTESYDPAPSYALGFGGAGYNVVTGDATSNNFLFGGEGRSVLYGGSYDDCLSLGAGGGVARTYGGNNHVWNYGDGLIYAGPGYNLIMCYHGTSRIVLDPAGEHEIYGFGPAKDQISFMGAFPDAAALDAATRVENANLGFDDEVHTVIDLPGGGKVTFILASVREQIGAVCLDFTDGWYATGWTEPDDYDAALFDPSVTPYATKPAITTPADEADDNQHFPNA